MLGGKQVKIFIHIGLNKTGTSSIQQFMMNNQEELAAQGLAYPEYGRVHGGHHALANALQQRPADVQKMVDAILEESAGAGAILISSEALHACKNVNLLADATREADVRIVVYLRDFVDYVSS